MRIVVTGSNGRLGGAIVDALSDAPFTGLSGPIAWDRSAFDLDAPDDVAARLDADHPDLVIHTAAWTDVDACAGDPELALRRNGLATGVLARACVSSGIDLAVVSTNEVFDGRRTDGVGYGPNDPVGPLNAYGASKLDGERQAAAAYAVATAVASTGSARPGAEQLAPQPNAEPPGARLAILRTAWLFGGPATDFPSKILAAAARAEGAGERLRVVADEFGSPTYAADVAEAVARLIEADELTGIHHLVNRGATSRAGWAREVLGRAGVPVEVEDIPASTWERASTPPPWGVLEPSLGPDGEAPRPWTEALAADLPRLMKRMVRSR